MKSEGSKPLQNVSPSEVLAIVTAVARYTFGAQARVVQINSFTPGTAAVDLLLQQWSMEGRRQIYSSHQIR